MTEPSSGTSSGPVPELDRTHWRTVPEAATELGISERAVWKRLQAGTLPRKQEGKRVYVQVQDTEPSSGTSSGTLPKYTEPITELVQEPNSALIEQIRNENNFLRSELTSQRETHAAEIARRDIAEGELRRLLLADRQQIAELQQRLAITAGPADPQDGQSVEKADERAEKIAESVADSPGHWWQFWKRRQRL